MHIICVYVPYHSSMLFLSVFELSSLFSKHKFKKEKSSIKREGMLDSLFVPVIHGDNPSLKIMWRLCMCYAL